MTDDPFINSHRDLRIWTTVIFSAESQNGFKNAPKSMSATDKMRKNNV